ncbi:MAG: nickel transporter, partial [Dialister micraerophilus]|nr:nickel transporter [Dialister micraerophilus]
MNFELIQQAFPLLLLGAGVTIEITAVSVAIGLIIG